MHFPEKIAVSFAFAATLFGGSALHAESSKSKAKAASQVVETKPAVGQTQSRKTFGRSAKPVPAPVPASTPAKTPPPAKFNAVKSGNTIAPTTVQAKTTKPATPAAAVPTPGRPAAYKQNYAEPIVEAKPVKLAKFEPEEESLPVPATGPLNLEQLIQLGIYNNAKVLRARRDADIARAERKAASDWKDPEIRISYSRDTDVEVGDAFSETEKGYEVYRGTETNREREIGFGGNAGEAQFDAERTRFTEKRYRTIERRVTPGASQDKVVTTEYEDRRTDTSTRRNRREIDVDRTGNNAGTITNTIGGSNIQQSQRRRVVGRTVTRVNHDDETDPEDQFGVLLRFPLPNPFEMRANIKKADAEIKARDYRVKSEEDQLIVEIRAVYEDLAYYEAQKGGIQALASHQTKYTEMVKMLAPDKIAQAAGNANQSVLDAGEAEYRAIDRRAELAQLVGLRDFTRISVPNNFRQRVVDAKSMDEDYLLQMASIYRADLQQLHAENEVAIAEYKAERAKAIPVGTFVDFGYGRNFDLQGRDRNEFQVRLGASLPLWSWLFNDAEKVPQAAARATSRQIGRLQENIAGDIHSALALLRAVQSNLEAYEKNSAALQLLMKNDASVGVGFAKNPQEVISETEENVLKNSIQRLQIYRSYNRAVLRLEAALGTRLEKVLSPQKR